MNFHGGYIKNLLGKSDDFVDVYNLKWVTLQCYVAGGGIYINNKDFIEDDKKMLEGIDLLIIQIIKTTEIF